MIIVYGESLIDMVAGLNGEFSPMPGGAPYNFARALAMRGLAVGYSNPFSSDRFGQMLKGTLEASGAVHLGATSARPTSLAIVFRRPDGQPDYTFYREAVADRDHEPGAAAALTERPAEGFHTGGLALVPPDSARTCDLLRHFGARGVLRTLDVNMRPIIARSMGVSDQDYRRAALSAIALADIVKVSDEDLAHLGLAGDLVDATQSLVSRQCRLVVLTLGERGAWALTATERRKQAAIALRPVDTVGAGDCFFAGFVAALLRRRDAIAGDRSPDAGELDEALQHATACAAFTLARKGCQPPNLDDVPRP